ncbi:phosphopantetheine-protein transferase [Bacillus pseudomycoides]|uniref:4'-phosphopantetheinyl transferase family protein n=1 Tax=Bacillus pseudomycoides TaxID=64104 RepID=UPI000BF79DD5|nr:4'-phosphopantetheinyl transferase superfamily protein [Bacillus pseudomycoides]PFZ10495.1 phosphopantetheine-protein transferase [Bacillus pseudomycoides]
MIETYILKIDRDLYEDEYNYLQQNVSIRTLKRTEKFNYREDAQRTLLGEILIRYALCKLNYKKNYEFTFCYNKYGKPYLENFPNIHFNISHSGKYVVCAIDKSPVGIDVETINPIDLTIVNSYFSKLEKEYLFQSQFNEKLTKFYYIWTMKESYIKREGKGLSIPLDSFCVFSLKDTNTAFYQIFQNEQAVCNVCASQHTKIQQNYLTINKLVNNYTKLLQNT